MKSIGYSGKTGKILVFGHLYSRICQSYRILDHGCPFKCQTMFTDHNVWSAIKFEVNEWITDMEAGSFVKQRFFCIVFVSTWKIHTTGWFFLPLVSVSQWPFFYLKFKSCFDIIMSFKLCPSKHFFSTSNRQRNIWEPKNDWQHKSSSTVQADRI